MKSSVSTTFVAFAALCTAQFQNLPNCAKPCASSLPANCNLDVKCICSNSSWISGISCCIKNACSPSDQQKTLQVATQLCDTVQVTLPSAASCAYGASAAAAGESTAASAVSVATMMASSAVAGAESTKSSAVSNALNIAGSATSAAGNTANSATASPTSSTATSSTSAQAATGAAQVFGSNMGAVGAAVAAVALL